MNLKGYRASKNLSMEDVAKELGITRQAYQMKESGKTRLSLEDGVRLSKVLGISLEEVYRASQN